MRLILIILISYLFCQTGLDIARQMETKSNPNDMISDMTLTIIKKKSKSLSFRSIIKDNYKKQIMWFTAPAADKGVAFLKIEDEGKTEDMRMWLPAFKKIRRISSKKKGDSFMGSDLSFEDLTNRDIKDYVYNILKIDSCNYNDTIIDCFELESVANDISSEYSKHITWVLEIEKDVFIPIKEHSFDEEGNLLKIKKIDFEKMDKYYIMHRLEVENVQEDHSTLLTVNDISLNNNFDDAMFIQRNLKIIPN